MFGQSHLTFDIVDFCFDITDYTGEQVARRALPTLVKCAPPSLLTWSPRYRGDV